MKRTLRLNMLLVTTLMALTLNLALANPVKAADTTPAGWHDTGLTGVSADLNYGTRCFDGTTPDLFRLNNTVADSGKTTTQNFNLATGQVTSSDRHFNLCNKYNGYYYQNDIQNKRAILYSPANPEGRIIDHDITHIATDGSLYVYDLQFVYNPGDKPFYTTRLFVSADGGLTWTERGQQFNGNLRTLALTKVDGRALYGVTFEKFTDSRTRTKFTIYFSPDAGVTWEKRSEREAEGIYLEPEFSLQPLPGYATPANVISLSISNGGSGSSGGSTLYLSTDGGRNFTEMGFNGLGGGVRIYYSAAGILRARLTYPYGFGLERSPDQGVTWQPLTHPIKTEFTYNFASTILFQPLEDAPDSFLIQIAGGSGYLWYSGDAGSSWQNLGDNLTILDITAYAPFKILGHRDGHLYTLDLPQTAKNMTRAAAVNGLPASYFFPETRHNLSGLFKSYWDTHGGLAQFGFPKTEPFRELNPSDGKIYTVQYFERARFEYHPEFSGTRYEVLLGLLGVQMTAAQRASNHGAFNYFPDMHYPGASYYPETGHNLRNTFKAYWEANGGLAIYGYPISEEYYEVNPDDGHTYVVQYFERNRFEWHPENAGTRYEVLLGLLGNALLRQKGWL